MRPATPGSTSGWDRKSAGRASMSPTSGRRCAPIAGWPSGATTWMRHPCAACATGAGARKWRLTCWLRSRRNSSSSEVDCGAMTYCVGLLVDTGLVLLSDSRTNAGVDQINTFRKMATFQKADDRVLVLMSAGNLGITQAVVNLLQDPPEDKDLPTRIMRASNM